MKRTILIALLVVLAIGALAVTYNTRWDSSIFIRSTSSRPSMKPTA